MFDNVVFRDHWRAQPGRFSMMVV